MLTRLPSLSDLVILFADRGARTKAREHTAEGFSTAIRLGATGLQTGVWRTEDDVLVVDGSGLARRFPRRALSDVIYESVRDVLPTLDDLFDAAADVAVMLAVSDDATATAVVDAARRHDAADRLWLSHSDLDVLARWRDLAPDVSLVNRTSIPDLPLGPERRAAELAAARIDAVALPEEDWSGGLVTLFHRFEVAGFADGAHYERQLARLIDMGIDGVSGDHADRMAAVVATFV